ncbi:hypothetical protein Vadar_018270 [Vaccinium darrowii]|uniref:Uncharacterized protein n=1 Tax=Vaccinium darrowii TaxID=229202 RepID=A0ACB7Y8S9_9ERIC|nr:hypothetical protein Vadar_018270 [Vaccinium darrowii]
MDKQIMEQLPRSNSKDSFSFDPDEIYWFLSRWTCGDFGNFASWLENEIFQQNSIPYNEAPLNPPPPPPYNPYGGVPVQGMGGYRNDFNSPYGNNIVQNDNFHYPNYRTDFSPGLGSGRASVGSVHWSSGWSHSQSMGHSQSGLNMGGYGNEPYMNDDTIYSTGAGSSMAFGRGEGGCSEDNCDDMQEHPEYRSMDYFLNHFDTDDDDDRFSLPDDDLEADIWYEANMHKLCTIALLQAVQERQQMLRKKKVHFHNSPLQGRGYMDDLWNSHPGRFYKVLKMPKRTFLKLVKELETMYGWTVGRSDVIACDESLAIFIHLLRGFTNDAIQERFQHSPETVSRQIHKILRCLRKFNYDKLQPTRSQDDPHPYLDRQEFYAPFKVQIVLSAMAFHNFIRRDRDQEDLFPPVERQLEYVFKDLADADPTLTDREDMPQYGVLNNENDPYMNNVRDNIREQLRRQRRSRQR